jgi:hypothetical protein
MKTKVLYRRLLAIGDTVKAEAAPDDGVCRFARGRRHACHDRKRRNYAGRLEFHGFDPLRHFIPNGILDLIRWLAFDNMRSPAEGGVFPNCCV